MKKKLSIPKATAMKVSVNLYFTFFLSVALLLSDGLLYAQNTKRLDSIIKASTLEMYGNPDKVIADGKEIVKQAGNDIDIKIRAYKLISDGYSSKRDYQKSLEYVIKANELLSQSGDRLLKIMIISKAGIQYHQLKIYDKAIQYLDEAEQLCLEYPIRDSVHVNLGINYIVRGFIYKEKLNCDIAISFFDRGINEILKSKDLLVNASKLSIAKYNKGNCYLLMSDNKLATKSFQEAIVFAKQIDANSLQAFAQKGLAQVYTLEGKYAEAIALLQEALKISMNVNDLVLNQEIYKGLSENYLAINEWSSYKNYRLKYLQTQTELKESERKSISNSLNKKEDDEKKKLEKEISFFIYGIAILFLILLLAVVFFVLSVKKAKHTIGALDEHIKKLQNEKPLRHEEKNLN
jgi:tetratricopeptide (TPR) repeat protein